MPSPAPGRRARTSKARASARRRTRRIAGLVAVVDRARRHVSAHRLRRAAALVAAHADAPCAARTGSCRPVSRARRSSRCADRSAAAPDRARPRDRDRLPRGRRRRARAGRRSARQANEGLLQRIAAQALRRQRARARRTTCSAAASGPSTASLDVVAPSGTDVYSPGRRDDRRDHAADTPRPDATGRGSTSSRRARPSLVVSRHAPPPRSGADGRLVRRSVDLEDRHDHRLLAASSSAGARPVHAGRGQPRLARGPPGRDAGYGP